MTAFILRDWRPDDIDDLAEICNNYNLAKQMRRNFPHPYTRKDAEAFLNMMLKSPKRRGIFRAIAADGRLIGSISVCLQEADFEKDAELGYWIAEEYWGRGIATRAAVMICKEAFESFDIARISSCALEDNPASCRVLEKTGFTFEGARRRIIYNKGKYHTLRLYGMLREDMA